MNFAQRRALDLCVFVPMCVCALETTNLFDVPAATAREKRNFNN